MNQANSAIDFWHVDRKIRFSHCDPAGIVFMPRFFELLNGVCEDWFAAIGHDYKSLIMTRRLGVGYAHASANFRHPVFMGDVLRFTLEIERLGTKSFTLALAAQQQATEILTATLVVVTTDLDTRRSVPIPADLRTAIEHFMTKDSQ